VLPRISAAPRSPARTSSSTGRTHEAHPPLLVTTLLAALGLVLAGPVGLVGTASAAGTGDVELVPASPDGEPRTSFTVDTDQDSIRFELVNLADAPREARLYAASANRGEGDGVSVSVAGSAPWLQLLAGGCGRALIVRRTDTMRAALRRQEERTASLLFVRRRAIMISKPELCITPSGSRVEAVQNPSNERSPA